MFFRFVQILIFPIASAKFTKFVVICVNLNISVGHFIRIDAVKLHANVFLFCSDFDFCNSFCKIYQICGNLCKPEY